MKPKLLALLFVAVAAFAAEKVIDSPKFTGSVNFANVANKEDIRAKLGAVGTDVRAFGAVGNGVTDDTAAMQAAINAGDVYIPAGTWLISSPLIVPSSRTIIAFPTAVIRRAAGTVTQGQPGLLANSNETTGNERITVIGGIWDAQHALQTNSDLPTRVQASFRFIRVNDLCVSDLTIRDPVSLSIQAATVQRAKFTNIYFDQTLSNPGHENDGLHINGPSSDIYVANLSGYTDDDFLAINAYDVSGWGPTTGNISRVTVHGVNAIETRNVIRILSAQNCSVTDVSISGVRATGYNSGIVITDYAQGGVSSVSNVSISDVYLGLVDQPYTDDPSLPVIWLSCNINSLKLRNITRAPGDITAKPLVRVGAGFTYRDLDFDGVYVNSTTGTAVFDVGNATIKSLRCANFQVESTQAPTMFLFASGTVDTFSLSRGKYKTTNAGQLIRAHLVNFGQVTVDGVLAETGVVIADGGAGWTAQHVCIENVLHKNGDSTVSAVSGASIGMLSLTNVQCDTLSWGPMYLDGTASVGMLNISGNRWVSCSKGIYANQSVKCRINIHGIELSSVATPFTLAPGVHSVTGLDVATNTTLSSDADDEFFTARGINASPGFTGFGAFPTLGMKNTSGGADAKLWDFAVNGNVLEGRVINDADTASGGNWLEVTRSGNSVSKVVFPKRAEFGAAAKLKTYTVSTLPVGTEGDAAYVTDANAPTFLGTLTGGGSVKTPVFYNGTAWVAF